MLAEIISRFPSFPQNSWRNIDWDVFVNTDRTDPDVNTLHQDHRISFALLSTYNNYSNSITNILFVTYLPVAITK